MVVEVGMFVSDGIVRKSEAWVLLSCGGSALLVSRTDGQIDDEDSLKLDLCEVEEVASLMSEWSSVPL